MKSARAFAEIVQEEGFECAVDLIEVRDSEHAAALAESQKRVAELEGFVEKAYREGWGEAAPKIPHVSRFNVDQDWRDSYARQALEEQT